MKLENQVVSLELAQKMKELGFKQESYFNYIKYQCKEKAEIVHPFEDRNIVLSCSCGETETLCSAYTVAELGSVLPDTFINNMASSSSEHQLHRLICEKQDKVWNVIYVCVGCMGRLCSTQADTEADARAKMLIYLVENKLITI